MTFRVGVIGARGYTGRDLCTLLLAHPSVSLVYAASGQAAGISLAQLWPELAPSLSTSSPGLVFEAPDPAKIVDAKLDVVFLALPNEKSAPYVEALDETLESEGVIVIDLSADHRFDDTWVYGLPERNRAALVGAQRVSNPGCYATGMQLAIAPFLDVLAAAPRVFGVSGYSGAGTTPSEKNDPAVLEDNLLAYSLVDHIHEREVTRHLRHPVRFTPHVASWFRGIHLTIDLDFTSPLTSDEMFERLQRAYAEEPLVEVQSDAPRVRDIVKKPVVVLGGATAQPSDRRGVIVATIDNLAKGAAVQAVQNMNLALRLDETLAILPAR